MATTHSKPATAKKTRAAVKPAKVKPSLKASPLAPDDSAAGASAPIAPVAAVAEARTTRSQAPAPAVSVERRRSAREKLAAPAVLQPASGDSSVDRGVQVQDLSLGGVGFVATETFEVGETYRITLGKGPLLLNARVKIISCGKTGHRMYRCGAEFC